MSTNTSERMNSNKTNFSSRRRPKSHVVASEEEAPEPRAPSSPPPSPKGGIQLCWRTIRQSPVTKILVSPTNNKNTNRPVLQIRVQMSSCHIWEVINLVSICCDYCGIFDQWSILHVQK